MLFHLFSLIDRLFLSCTVGEPHIRSNNCFISNRLRFINAWFCWHYAIIAADKSHLMAVTSSSMTIQFNVSFQKEKMTILLPAVLSIRQILALLLFSVCLFYTLVKVPYLQPVHSKNFSIIQGPSSAVVCIIRLHGLKYKEKTNIFK